MPRLFNYLPEIIDTGTPTKEARFVLTGSNNFLLQQNISQSLAGRIGYLDLLPLSHAEIMRFVADEPAPTTSAVMLNGAYPEVWAYKRTPRLWYSAYLRTYVERDVRQLSNVIDTRLFTKFLQLCAGRVGQQLNISALSIAAGVEMKTVNRWLSILEASFVIYLLPPFHQNYNKRLVKTPKLYFYDTGLASYLLSIYTETEIALSHFRGALFENLVLGEYLKKKHNEDAEMKLYYWRDNKGLEIDLLVEEGATLMPVEIKASQTFSTDYLGGIKKWNALAKVEGGRLVMDATPPFGLRDGIEIKNWRVIG